MEFFPADDFCPEFCPAASLRLKKESFVLSVWETPREISVFTAADSFGFEWPFLALSPLGMARPLFPDAADVEPISSECLQEGGCFGEEEYFEGIRDFKNGVAFFEMSF